MREWEQDTDYRCPDLPYRVGMDTPILNPQGREVGTLVLVQTSSNRDDLEYFVYWDDEAVPDPEDCYYRPAPMFAC